MSGRTIIGAALLTAAAALVCGCTCTTSQRAAAPEPSAVTRSLVLPSPAMMDDASQAQADWEYARNDSQLGSPPDLTAKAEYGETITYDRRWTINGQPREFSGTFLYSVQQRFGR